MRKKILAMLLAVVMIMAMLPTAFAADASGAFVIEDGVLTKYNGEGGDVVIPDGVTSIGNMAFQKCTSLTGVVIPDSVKSIGAFAFSNCTSLVSLTIGSGVTSISGYAFSGCTSLTSVTLPNSLTSIGGNAFANCTSLTDVTIPESVTSIFGDHSFNDFSGTPWQENQGDFVVVNGILFKYQGQGGDVTIPDGVTGIGMAAFNGCESVTSVVIPDGVTYIGGSAFQLCTGMTSITIPVSVTTIGYEAFWGCGLTDVYYGGTESQWNQIAGIAGWNVSNIPSNATIHYNSAGSDTAKPTEPTKPTEPAASGACGNNLTWTLADGVLTISGTGAMVDYTFEERPPWRSARSEITSVVIENGVTSIGDWAFPGCDSLTSVTIPNSVTSIGYVAFDECGSLTSVTIPYSVTSIGSSAFFGCNSLTSITIEAADLDISDAGFGWGVHFIFDEEGNAVGGGDHWIDGVTIFGYNGSPAQDYAEWHEMTFVSLGDAPAKPTEPSEPSEPTKPGTPEITFNDVPAGSWYASAVSFAVEHNLLEGDGKGNFNPNGNLTRAQIFAILARLDGTPATGGNWSETATQWAMTKGVSTGENPSADVTREQLVVMLWRYKGEPGADTSKLSGYPDRAYLHDWGVTAMAWAVNTGIIEGSDGWLNPQGTATRAQAVTMIQRYCGN